MTKTEKRRLGDVGENIACEYLRRRGFDILERNYLRKWGEIDIVATKDGVMRFVEVKSIRDELASQGVSRVTSSSYRPEENMHAGKLKRLTRIIQTYMLEKRLDCDFQLDLVTVIIDESRRVGRAEIIENIIVS
jgi:putative endonuclease